MPRVQGTDKQSPGEQEWHSLQQQMCSCETARAAQTLISNISNPYQSHPALYGDSGQEIKVWYVFSGRKLCTMLNNALQHYLAISRTGKGSLLL